MTVELVHDHLVQRGGAERLMLSISDAFPGSPVTTSFYEPELTYDGFLQRDVQTLPINKATFLRSRHRSVLPLLAPSFSAYEPEADLVVASSSGWAHGVGGTAPKLVYFHSPARWLYCSDAFMTTASASTRLAARAVRPFLARWDKRAAASISRFVANSTETRRRLQIAYGVDAEVLPPPVMLDAAGDPEEVEGLEPGFVLCVARLLSYKNVDAVIDAFNMRPHDRLVIVGTGPEADRLRSVAGPNVRFISTATEQQLRWLYASCRVLVTASYEDFGLTPCEAAIFGKPTVALKWGGHIDSVVPGVSGTFFARPTPDMIHHALRSSDRYAWDPLKIHMHARKFDRGSFMKRLRDFAAELVPRSYLGPEPLFQHDALSGLIDLTAEPETQRQAIGAALPGTA